jgi:hypothetical protein
MLLFRKNHENRAWIQEKYESFSRNFVHLFLNEGKEHLVSEFDRMSKSSCSWDSIKQRVDMYLDEVNKKYGPTFLDLVRTYQDLLLFCHFIQN